MLRLLSFVAATASAAAWASGANPVKVRDCAAGSSLFTINSVSLTPTAPAAGETVTLHLDYTVPDGTTITDGTTTYAVTLNYIPFQPSTNPLCQDIPCPLGPGNYVNASMSQWPSGVTGSFKSTMTWKDPAATLLLCVETSGTLSVPQAMYAPGFTGIVAVREPTPVERLVQSWYGAAEATAHAMEDAAKSTP